METARAMATRAMRTVESRIVEVNLVRVVWFKVFIAVEDMP